MDWASIHVFGDAVRAVAAAFPDKPALVGEGHSLTFKDIDVRMNRLANGLAELGVQPGERVAVLARNRPEAFEVYGASKAGLIVLPLNWRLARDELLHPLTDGEPTVILAAPEFADLIDAMRPQLAFEANPAGRRMGVIEVRRLAVKTFAAVLLFVSSCRQTDVRLLCCLAFL